MNISETTLPPDLSSQATAPDPPSAPRLHFIDGLRGLAMLMVLLYHCWLFGGTWWINLPLGHHRVNLAGLLSFGHVGVNLFLVLSGFCLYWPFVKGGLRREPTLWEFARKRCRRILPPYYVALLIFGGWALFQAARDGSQADMAFSLRWLWTHGVMVHNLRPDTILANNGSLWSLALEFQLYILFPVLVEAYRRWDRRCVLLAVFVFSTTYRFVVAHGDYLPDDGFGYTLAYSVFGRCFEFALGMFLADAVARWHHTGRSPLRPMDYVFVALIVTVAVLDGRHGHFQTLTDVMWGLIFAALLLAASRPQSLAQRLLSKRGIVSLGIFSYSVYLIHLPLVIALGGWSGRRHFSNTAQVAYELLFVMPVMLGLGYLFHLAFEKPFMSAPQAKKSAPTLRFAPAVAENKTYE